MAMEGESCRLIFVPELVDRGCEHRDAAGSLEARFLESHIRCVCSQRQCLSSLASFADDVERALQQESESRVRCLQNASRAIANKPASVVSDSMPIVPMYPVAGSKVGSSSIDKGANPWGLGGPGSDNCFDIINGTGPVFKTPISRADLIGFTQSPRPKMVSSPSPLTLVDGVMRIAGSEETEDPTLGTGAEVRDGGYDCICSYPDLEGTGWLSRRDLSEVQAGPDLPCVRSRVHKQLGALIHIAESFMVHKVPVDTEARSRPSFYFPGCDGAKKRKRSVESADVPPEEVTLLVNQQISPSEDPGDADGSSSVTAESSPRLEKDWNVRVDDNDNCLITKLAPLIKRQIETALNSTLLPLVAVLRSREEDEQRHREQMLALEEQKLALKREKLLFKRRRVVQREPHSQKKRSGLRVKTPVL